MDPVDKTFDTLYYWSQRAKRGAQGVASSISETSDSVADAISSTLKNTSFTAGEAKGDRLASNSHQTRLGIWGYSLPGLAGLKTKVEQHKAVSLLLGCGALALLGYSVANGTTLSSNKKRRRAQRLPNGARKDVVLLVGSVTEPLTRYIAHDLENRGFIVYVTSTESKADQKYFNNESTQDIKSLIVSPDSIQENEFNAQQLRKFDYLLSSDHIPFQGAQPNKLNLVGIIFIPDLYYATGKFHLIPTTIWTSNIMNRVLLPLNLLTNGLIGIAEKYDSNLIFLTPTISSSLNLPFHSLENITSEFLHQISQNLSSDYEGLNITNVKLGAINITSSNNNRKTYGIKGIPIKSLHYKLFDLLYGEDNNSVEYVGVGARFLAWFGRCLPRFMVSNYFANYFGNE